MRMSWRVSVAGVAALAALLAGAWFALKDVPFLQYRPACRDAETAYPLSTVGGDLKFMWAAPTTEFWRAAIKKSEPPCAGAEADCAIRDGKILVSPSFFLPFGSELSKWAGDWAEEAYSISGDVIWAIYRRRVESGLVTGAEKLELMRPALTEGFEPGDAGLLDDALCPIARELIMKGGRFAGE